MTFSKDQKARYQAANQEDQRAGYHECLIGMIKMHFVGGLRPSIQQVVESRYASLTDRVMLLSAAKESEIAVSVGLDKKLMELEAEIAAFRVSPGSSPGQGGGKAGRGGQGASRGAPCFNQKQQQGQSQKAQGQSSQLTHRGKVWLWKNWIICHKCYQWGKHRANECKLSATQI